jgi:hypothetical protein
MYIPKTPKTPNLLVDKKPAKIPDKNSPKIPGKKPHQKSSVNVVNRTQTKIAGYTITRYFHLSFFLYIYKNPKKKQTYPKKQKKSCK